VSGAERRIAGGGNFGEAGAGGNLTESDIKIQGLTPCTTIQAANYDQSVAKPGKSPDIKLVKPYDINSAMYTDPLIFSYCEKQRQAIPQKQGKQLGLKMDY